MDSICAVINNACTLLEEEYAMVFQQQCKQGFPSGYLDLTQAYNAIQSSLQQGSIRLQPSDIEKTKANFLVTNHNQFSKAISLNIFVGNLEQHRNQH